MGDSLLAESERIPSCCIGPFHLDKKTVDVLIFLYELHEFEEDAMFFKK